MNEELREKLIKDLEKSGFGSEMRALKIFQDFNWRTQSNTWYFDRDEQKTREIDISAYRSISYSLNGKACLGIIFQIFAEVKKTEKPWIVFRHNLDKVYNLCAWNNMILSKNLPSKPFKLVEHISRNSLLRSRSWIASGVHHAFKEPSAPSSWYQAFISACKAGEHSVVDEMSLYREASEVTDDIMKKSTSFHFIQPLVILDGTLVAAELSDTGDILIEEVSSAPFNFEFKTANYDRSSYRVDLVTLTGIEEYLKQIEKRQLDIAEGCMELSGYDLEKFKRNN